MSFINLANNSFRNYSRGLASQKSESKMSIQELDNKINECKQSMKGIKSKIDEVYGTWVALKEDYQALSFAKVFDTTVKESVQCAIDRLKVEYEDAKSTMDFYKQLKNKALMEADVTLPKDLLFDPDSSGVSLKSLAKDADEKEKAELKARELDEKRKKYREGLGELIGNIKESMADGDDPSDTLEIIFNAYVPSQGKADTVAGEYARAMMKILYRDWNDGDLFYEGYGIESSCGSAAAYLMGKEWFDEFDSIRERQLTDDAYTRALNEVTTLIIEYLLDRPELFYEPNDEDYLQSDVSELEENQPRYEFELYFSDDLVELSNSDEWDIRYATDFVENYLSWQNTFYGAEVEVWSNYDEYVMVTNLTRDGVDVLEGDFSRDVDGFWEELVNELRDKFKEEDDEDDEEDEDIDESVMFVSNLSTRLNEGLSKETMSKVYSILERYGDDESDVQEAFRKATLKERKQLLMLVK